MFSAALLAVGSFTVLRRALPGEMFRTVLGHHWAATFLSIQIPGVRAHAEMLLPPEMDPKGRFPFNGFRKKNHAFSQQLPGPTAQPPAAGPLHSLTRGISFVCRWWESLGGLGRPSPPQHPKGESFRFVSTWPSMAGSYHHSRELGKESYWQPTCQGLKNLQ